MLDTIAEYLEQQRASFIDVAPSDVDSLVFSTIAYFNLEHGAVGRAELSERIPLPLAICGISHKNLYGGIWLENMGGDDFLAALLASPRFMDVEVGYYTNEISTHFEKQFAAMTFFLPGDAAYIAFRGTDNSLAGWKEDFNLTFMDELPSQVSARTYLEDIAETGVGHLLVGGHSKGGNLAEYAVLTCRDQTFAKVEHVFSHDGPGFAFAPSKRIDQADYLAKLSKTVPGASIFGLLMETRACYRIVHSAGVLFAQHAPTHWEVADGDFVTLDAISPEAAIISGTLNSWSDLYDRKQRETFIDAVYDIFRASNADSWREFSQDRADNMRAIVEATTNLTPTMRSTLFGMLRDIAPIMASEVAKHARLSLPLANPE